MGERADGIEGKISPQLEPYLGADVVENERLEAGVLEQSHHLFRPLRVHAVELAHGKTVALHVLDDPRRHDFARRINDAAQNSFGIDSGGDFSARVHRLHRAVFVRHVEALEIPPGNSVLQRKNDGVLSEKRIELRRDFGQHVGLDRQHHQILRSGLLVAVGGFDAGDDVLAAVRRDDLEPVFLDCRQVITDVNDADRLFGTCQMRGHQAADGPRADHANLHRLSPPRPVFRPPQSLPEGYDNATAPVLHRPAFLSD